MLTRLMGVVLAVLLLAGGTLAAEPPAKRLPVPEAAAREKALVTIRDVFKSELAKAKTPAELSALSEKLAKTAAETKDDPVARFVLWQLAVEQATKAGDLKTAFAAIDDMTANYELDDLTVKSRTFVGLVPQLTSKTFRDPLVSASGLIGRAVGADRYDIAKAISEQTNALAQKFGDPALKKELLAQKAEVERLEKAYADVPAASKTLETNVTDPAANILVGKYQIEKGNWEAALSYLALSGDPQYKDIAAKELAQPKEAAERLAIADGWWTVAEADKTPLKGRLKVHAAELYTVLLPDATGLTKGKIEIHLADVAKIAKSPLEIKMPEGTTKIGLSALQKKLQGRVVYDAKTDELTITYDWRSPKQLKDFEPTTVKPTFDNGTMTLHDGEMIRSIVKFDEVVITCAVYVPIMNGKLINTSGGTSIGLGGDSVDTMYLAVNGKNVAQHIVPNDQRKGLQQVRLTVIQTRVDFEYGNPKDLQKLAKDVNGVQAGQISLLGGKKDYQFGTVVLTGKVDKEWSAKFLAQ